MDKFLNNEKYMNNIKEISNKKINWEKLRNTNFLITGATGMVGKVLIDVIMYLNEAIDLNCTVYALGRNIEKAKLRFPNYFDSKNFIFIEKNINEELELDVHTIDYIFHAASSTHPVQYAKYPITTITSNIIGLNNLLSLASNCNNKRFIFASSVEIYGENKGDVEKMDEDYLGYINCNTLRAGYPESKRAGEALCQAYMEEKNIDTVVIRFPRLFGPTMLPDDSKASSQFIKNALNNENIVLKSEGKQYYSYGYVADAVYAVLYILDKGIKGEAYNVADDKFDITLKDLAKTIANSVGKEVIFDLPSDIESKGYSKATKAILDSKKINTLGWKIESDIESRIKETIEILKNIEQ